MRLSGHDEWAGRLKKIGSAGWLVGWQCAYRFHLSLRSSRFILPVRRLRHSRDRCADDFVCVLMDKRIRFRANELDTIETRTRSERNRHFLLRSFYRRTYSLIRYGIDQCWWKSNTRQFLMPRNPSAVSLARMFPNGYNRAKWFRVKYYSPSISVRFTTKIYREGII